MNSIRKLPELTECDEKEPVWGHLKFFSVKVYKKLYITLRNKEWTRNKRKSKSKSYDVV